VATVGAVITDLLYTAISLGLVHMVGQTLSRNSRAFLPQKPGQDGMAEAVSRVLVVAYYLLALGFIALTMPTWSHVPGPGKAMELLSVQVGILLLVLGGLHLAGTAVLARLRRNRPWLRAAAAAAAAPAGEATIQGGLAEPAADGAATDQRPRSTPFWRPQHRDNVN
jgi:peptidoglycan/LPS O-acetylase OafA/YrhL